MTPVNPINGPAYGTLAMKIYAGVDRGIFSTEEAACFMVISVMASEHFESLHPDLPKLPGIAWGDLKRILTKLCPHERLNEDGICRQCGADRRGI